MKRLLPLCAAALVLFFQGCAPKPVTIPLSERIGATSGGGSEKTAGAAVTETDKDKRGTITEESLSPGSSGEKGRGSGTQTAGQEIDSQLQDIYFEFDSYAVRPEDVPVLKGIAAWLAARPKAKLSIEGHCDERGTTDYNLALGQKRAEAAKDYLLKLGVGAKRLKAISYGKEAPLDPSHSEQAWQKNRRVHFTSR